MDTENNYNYQGNEAEGGQGPANQSPFEGQPDHSQSSFQGQPVYDRPVYSPPEAPLNPADERPMSVKDWILTLLVLCLPCVNIIMMFVWGLGSNGNVNRKNYAKAALIIWAVLFALYLLISLIAGISIASIAGQMGDSY